MIKSQSVDKKKLVKWVSMVKGTFKSINPYDFGRKFKTKFNYKKKRKK
jgi:hypothetical protein